MKDPYRLAHSYRVVNIGKEFAEKEGLNVEDLMIACLLHDVSDFEC
ncbi:HD domain-containing protein [Holdemanella biformis]|uniref:HD domain-containing protein n=1 Tax=Holdemanella porci TaxID=2652276 RepID=A0A6N7V2B3_9FIRM|nr:HD domain-containing protein [Holdemanella porci]